MRIEGAFDVAGSPSADIPREEKPARGRRGASPGASLLPDVPPQPRFHDLRMEPSAGQAPQLSNRLVAEARSRWVALSRSATGSGSANPEARLRAATLPVPIPCAETSGFSTPYLSTTISRKTRWSRMRTLCPRASDLTIGKIPEGNALAVQVLPRRYSVLLFLTPAADSWWHRASRRASGQRPARRGTSRPTRTSSPSRHRAPSCHSGWTHARRHQVRSRA